MFLHLIVILRLAENVVKDCTSAWQSVRMRFKNGPKNFKNESVVVANYSASDKLVEILLNDKQLSAWVHLIREWLLPEMGVQTTTAPWTRFSCLPSWRSGREQRPFRLVRLISDCELHRWRTTWNPVNTRKKLSISLCLLCWVRSWCSLVYRIGPFRPTCQIVTLLQQVTCEDQ